MLPPIQKKSSMRRDRLSLGRVLVKEAPEIGVEARSCPISGRPERAMDGGIRTDDTGPTLNTAALMLLDLDWKLKKNPNNLCLYLSFLNGRLQKKVRRCQKQQKQWTFIQRCMKF